MNLAAGVMRMPLLKYIPALVVGGAMWATLYGVLGLATINAIVAAAQRNPVGAVLSVLAVVALLLLIEVFTRRARSIAGVQPPASAEPAVSHDDEAPSQA